MWMVSMSINLWYFNKTICISRVFHWWKRFDGRENCVMSHLRWVLTASLWLIDCVWRGRAVSIWYTGTQFTSHENECVIFVTAKHDKSQRFFVCDFKLLCINFHACHCVHPTLCNSRFGNGVCKKAVIFWYSSHDLAKFSHLLCLVFISFSLGGRSIILRTSHCFGRNHSVLLCDVHAWHGRKSC